MLCVVVPVCTGSPLPGRHPDQCSKPQAAPNAHSTPTHTQQSQVPSSASTTTSTSQPFSSCGESTDQIDCFPSYWLQLSLRPNPPLPCPACTSLQRPHARLEAQLWHLALNVHTTQLLLHCYTVTPCDVQSLVSLMEPIAHTQDGDSRFWRRRLCARDRTG